MEGHTKEPGFVGAVLHLAADVDENLGGCYLGIVVKSENPARLFDDEHPRVPIRLEQQDRPPEIKARKRALDSDPHLLCERRRRATERCRESDKPTK
jgi:hypothetical protein